MNTNVMNKSESLYKRLNQIRKTTIIMFWLMTMALPLLAGYQKDDKVAPQSGEEQGNVSLDDPNIHVMGVQYISRTPEKLSFTRFSDEVLRMPASARRFTRANGLSTTGISIQFKTRSKSILLEFSPEPGMSHRGIFKVFRDGKELKTVRFPKEVQQPIQIDLNKLPTDKEYVYEILLPSSTNVSLTKLELDTKSGLVTYVPAPKRVYIGFGDSITHGIGQGGATYLTYPYLLAKALDMNLYNLAVSGAKISMPMAETAKDLPQAAVITVLIGYNDFSSGNRTAEQIDKDYRQFLTEIRKNQPATEIYCITLLHTTNMLNVNTGLTPDQVRNVVKNIVTEFQETDNKLHLVEGDKIINSIDYLHDRVHLNAKGAQKLAEGLEDIISTP